MRVMARLLLPLLALMLVGCDARAVEKKIAMPSDKRWPDVEKLVGEQKLQEAVPLVESILTDARSHHNEADWSKALVRLTQLRLGLHGYETAVRQLKDQPWPEGKLPHLTLDLFYAQTLMTYLDAYSWEIRQRERVDIADSKEPVDLKAWTADQIYAEALKAYDDVWVRRDELSHVPVSALAGTLEPNNYPPRVRGTLRDAVSYLAVALLANSAYWSPQATNELYRLPFDDLTAGGEEESDELHLTDGAMHPLVRALAVLGDLEAWHAGEDQDEAALEARLERIRRLNAAFPDKRSLLIAHLTELLPHFKSKPWWAVGMAELAELQKEAGRLVQARDTARRGADAFPEALGGQRCHYLAQTLEASDYQLAAMSTDAAHRRSLEIRHKNVKKLYFRAYAFDLIKHVEGTHDYSLLPNYQDYQRLAGKKPTAEWSVDLPATPDLDLHRTFVTPPLEASGLYFVVASARADFQDDDNRVAAVAFVVSDLVLLTRNDTGSPVEVLVVDGKGGKPVAGAKVILYRFDYGKGHEIEETSTTDEKGAVHFDVTRTDYSSYFLVAKKGDQVAIDPQYIYLSRETEAHQVASSFVYTDRAIYRPGQTAHFKVVAYRGSPDKGDFHAAPGESVTVTLLDANRETVASKTLKTNAFGSVAGELKVPTGKLLGAWSVHSSFGKAEAQIKVEEYKRPTFEVSLKDPAAPLRLNKPAKLTGEAKYYFGLPVVTGQVSWRVTREPVYPWWWGFFYWRGDEPTGGAAQVVAAGTSKLDEKGSFSLDFVPEVEEKTESPKSNDLTYRYAVSADLTDEGGETRSAQRTFRLGFVAVEATLETPAAFLRAGTAATLALHRTSLDGLPKAGKGHWRILALKQPETTATPADLPLPEPEKVAGAEAKTLTPGDLMRPRWSPSYTPEAELARWPDGALQAQGDVTHDAQGTAEAALPPLPPGAYRIRYETLDDFGARFETFKDVVVAGQKTPLNLPAVFLAETTSVPVGGTARFFVHSGLKDQTLFLDLYRSGKLRERRVLKSGGDDVFEIPVTEADRGGFGATLSLVTDHQFVRFQQTVHVPWDNKDLTVEFATFRDLLQPGQHETWKVHVKGANAAGAAAEILAYMYDKSLDVFAPHAMQAPTSVYPDLSETPWMRANLMQAHGQVMAGRGFERFEPPPPLTGDRLTLLDGYGIGGMGRTHGYALMTPAAAASPRKRPSLSLARKDAARAEAEEDAALEAPSEAKKASAPPATPPPVGGAPASGPLRSNFSETAFFKPQLRTDKNGDVSLEFQVPDSVTAWNVWVLAVTKDLHAGLVKREARTVKNLMVRPYMPRFLREGDKAELKVVVNNASDHPLAGQLTLAAFDPETEADMTSAFGLDATTRAFAVAPGGGANVTFSLTAPRRIGPVAFRVTATAGDESDGELRPLPILPSRMHLTQSRFVTLKDQAPRTMTFEELAKADDPTRVSELMTVSVDGQLFYSVLKALPYLIQYPYECTEQTLNRFLATGIVSSVFDEFPAVATMAKQLSKRESRLESFDQDDPNRRMALEETPWLDEARGNTGNALPLVNVLDQRIAKAQRNEALAKLKKAQTASGGFPWFPGGPPSPWMTLYLMHGFAKAAEFKVDVPKEMVTRGWAYLAQYMKAEELPRFYKDDCCFEMVTFLNYVASSYPDQSWTANAFSAADRQQMLAHSFKHWKEHAPLLKAYLALTLKRAGRAQDAKLVFDSVMDSTKTAPDQGTFWAPEDRSWLWYNDTVETHAFALRTLMELEPQNAKKDGLVLWLFLNKKLNHWKSTRATSEAIYALVHYLKKTEALGGKEEAKVTFGGKQTTFTFAPEKYTGKAAIVVPGPEVDPATMSAVTVEKSGKGMMFASATWQFSTDRLPAAASGDFFAVTRRYFKRVTGQETTLKPLANGEALAVGDEVEVQLSLTSKQAAEYVHLRDPRGAGFEPVSVTSGYRAGDGLGWYEEVRDSGANFFFEQLPAGEYTFKYRIRATMGGAFRVGPATVQSMYAPEFTAYSAGATLAVKP